MNPEQCLNPGDLVLLSTPYSVRVPSYSDPRGDMDGSIRQRTLGIVVTTSTFYEGTTQETRTSYKMHLVVVNSTLTWVLAEDANAVVTTRDDRCTQET